MQFRRTASAALLMGAAIFGPSAALADSIYTWSGVYVGAFIGGGHATFVDEATGPFASDNGLIGGGVAGYQHQFGRFVLGVEADIAASGIEGVYDAGLVVNGGQASLDAIGSVRGRAGVAWRRMQFYGTAGFGYGRVTDIFDGVADANWMTGWTAGAGAAYAVTDALSIDLRYLHVDLGPKVFFGGAARESMRADIVTLGANYRF